MQLLKLLQKFFFCLLVIRIRLRNFNGTGRSTLRDFIKSYTFSAFFRVNLVLVIALICGLVGALFGTVSTKNTTFRNSVSHCLPPIYLVNLFTLFASKKISNFLFMLVMSISLESASLPS